MRKFRTLVNGYGRSALIEEGKKSGVLWNEDGSNPGVNWMRFSSALVRFLEEGNDLDLEDSSTEILQEMLSHYTALRELQKKMMVPNIKYAVQNLQQDSDVNHNFEELVGDAHKHLDTNGGQNWSNKVLTLSFINKQIRSLQTKLDKLNNKNTTQK